MTDFMEGQPDIWDDLDGDVVLAPMHVEHEEYCATIDLRKFVRDSEWRAHRDRLVRRSQTQKLEQKIAFLEESLNLVEDRGIDYPRIYLPWQRIAEKIAYLSIPPSDQFARAFLVHERHKARLASLPRARKL